MRSEIIKILDELTDEERRILDGDSLKLDIYFGGDMAVVSNSSLFGGRSDIGIRRHTRFVQFPSHSHTFIELMAVVSGEITHVIGEREIKLTAGDLLFLNKHVSHSVKLTGREDIAVNIRLSDSFVLGAIEKLSGGIFSDFLQDNVKESGGGAYLHFRTAKNVAVENLCENIILELIGDGDGEIAARTLEILLLYLSREGGGMLAGGAAPRNKDAERKAKILAYIRNNCAGATLGELSGQLYLTVPYLSKTVKDYFGKSFKELLLEERMERARSLITESDMQIGEIVRTVGYDNESYFHREFKKRFGTTPLSIRKNEKAAKSKL